MNHSKSYNWWALAGVVAMAMILVSAFTFYSAVHANPSDLNQSNALATTTVAYLTPGLATSTEVYDSYNGGVAEPNASESAVMFLNFTASSTSSVLNVKLQYSQNGVDWFDDNLIESTNSTSTPVYNMGIANSYTWTASGTATSSKAITVPTPTRYTRAQVSVTGANAAVWKVIIAKKQQP